MNGLRDLASYAQLRDAGRRLAPPARTIRTVKLYYRQVLRIRVIGRSSRCWRKAAEHARFTGGLAPFLEPVPKAFRKD